MPSVDSTIGGLEEAEKPIHAYDEAGKAIETHEHAGDFKEW